MQKAVETGENLIEIGVEEVADQKNQRGYQREQGDEEQTLVLDSIFENLAGSDGAEEAEPWMGLACAAFVAVSARGERRRKGGWMLS